MSRSKPGEQPYNLNNELAKARTRAAADRTLMAWIRTSLSLISFGFGIPTIVKAIEETRIGSAIHSQNISVIVGLSFISVGVFAMAAALREHRRFLRQIQSDHYIYKTSNLAEIIAVALLVIGVVTFIGVILRAINS